LIIVEHSRLLRLIVFEKYYTATRLQRQSCFWRCKDFLLSLGADSDNMLLLA